MSAKDVIKKLYAKRPIPIHRRRLVSVDLSDNVFISYSIPRERGTALYPLACAQVSSHGYVIQDWGPMAGGDFPKVYLPSLNATKDAVYDFFVKNPGRLPPELRLVLAEAVDPKEWFKHNKEQTQSLALRRIKETYGTLDFDEVSLAAAVRRAGSPHEETGVARPYCRICGYVDSSKLAPDPSFHPEAYLEPRTQWPD